MTRVTLLIASVTAALAACANPTYEVTRYAQSHHFQGEVISGSQFRHRVYRAEHGLQITDTLHVYIEGDGTPFLVASRIATDPTPRDPLMLRLMALDPAVSVYLGRPCYFDTYREPPCSPVFWTLRRFSPEVVDSLVVAVLAEAARVRATHIELYGHSGGGTLAVLIAARLPRLPQVTRVVTIGANLDINAWCALHGYTPLVGSLNPIDVQNHSNTVPTLHLVGSDDANTPPFLIQGAVDAGVGGTVRVSPGFTHNCCWEQAWTSILSESVPEEDGIAARPKD